MKFTFKTSPYCHGKQTTQSMMKDVIIALLAVFGFSLVYYVKDCGMSYALRAITMMIVACISALATEALWFYFTKQPILKSLSQSFPLVTAMILVLMSPLSTSYYAIAVCTVMAIFFGKLVFGGFGQNIFNPAAVGRVIMSSSFAGVVVSKYLIKVADLTTGATPTTEFSKLGWLATSPEAFNSFVNQFGGMGNMFFGFYPGAIGETSTFILLVAAIFLSVRKVIDWRIPTVYIGTIFSLSLIVGIFHQQPLSYSLFHVLTGGAMFGAVFMLTDPVTAPTSIPGRIIFAIGAGMLTVLLRLKSNYPEGVMFAILLMNMMTPAIEMWIDGNQVKQEKNNMVKIGIMIVVSIAVAILCAVTIAPKQPVKAAVEVKKGSPMNISDDYGNFKAKVVSKDGLKYVVSSHGYGMIDPDGHYKSGGHEMKDNVFEITLDENHKVVSIVCSTFADTTGIGDVAVNDLSSFVGLDSSSDELSVDAVSGATWTSKSVMAALQAVSAEVKAVK